MAELSFSGIHFIRIKMNIAEIANKFKVNTRLFMDDLIITGSEQEIDKLQQALKKEGLPQGEPILSRSKKQ